MRLSYIIRRQALLTGAAGQNIPFVLHLFVFADNAVKARAQVFSKGAPPTEQVDITNGFLLDNSFVVTSGASFPPFEWQNVRYYSEIFRNNAQGQQVVVSFSCLGGSFFFTINHFLL